MLRTLRAVRALLLLTAGPAAADTLVLASGDVLQGTIVERTDQAWVVDHPDLGRLTLAHERVSAVSRGEAPPVAARAPSRRVRPGLFGTRFLRGWERHVELGVNGSEGNTNEFDGLARLLARSEDDRRRWNVDLAYFYSTRDDEATEHKGYLDLQRDWLHPGSRWFQFGETRWDYDQFEDWSHRVAAAGGTGYELVRRRDFGLRGRLGLGLQRSFGGEDDRITPELLVGIEEEWRIAPRVKLTASNVILLDLREPGELRNFTDAALYLDVAETDGLGVKLGIHNEYESDVPDGVDENDLRYYGALTVDF